MARMALQSIEAELAGVRARIAPFRRALYDARMNAHERCIKADSVQQKITWWRPLSKAEFAELDAAASLFREQTEHLLPAESRLKMAVKEATWALRDAEHDEKMGAVKAAAKAKKEASNAQFSLL
jgi:hypothetical protein